MIRNYQRTSGDSNVDLSPIYSSLQTINAFLFNLDIETTLSRAVYSLSSEVTDLQTDFNSLNSIISEITDDITGLSADINYLNSEVSSLRTDYNSLSNDVSSLYNRYTSLNRDVVSLITDYMALNSEISEINGNISEINGDINTINQKISTLGLLPDQITLTNYINEDVYLTYVQYSTVAPNFKFATGNVDLNITSVSAFNFSTNRFFKANIDISYYNSSTFQKNNIKECTLNWYGDFNNSLAILQNTITDMIFRAWVSADGKYFQNNRIYNLKIDNYGNNSFTHAGDTYYNAHVFGYNEFVSCNLTNLTNENQCVCDDCTIKNAVLNSVATIRDCSIAKLNIRPENATLFSFSGNTIDTLVIPQYMTIITGQNTISNLLTY